MACAPGDGQEIPSVGMRLVASGTGAHGLGAVQRGSRKGIPEPGKAEEACSREDEGTGRALCQEIDRRPCISPEVPGEPSYLPKGGFLWMISDGKSIR